MKLPAPAQKLRFFLVLLVLLSGACALFAEKPDEPTLRERVSAFIALGWGWLHAENVGVVRSAKEGDGYLVTFDYDLVVDRDAKDLPPEELDRFKTFLPMCAESGVRRGARCRVTESALFVRTGNYGWMPDAAVRHSPQLLPEISAWKDPRASPQ